MDAFHHPSHLFSASYRSFTNTADVHVVIRFLMDGKSYVYPLSFVAFPFIFAADRLHRFRCGGKLLFHSIPVVRRAHHAKVPVNYGTFYRFVAVLCRSMTVRLAEGPDFFP